jgi:hypothetical protein
MMRILAIALIALLAGCGSFGLPGNEIQVPSNLSETAKAATKAISEAKVALITANNTITTQVKAELMTKEDGRELGAKIDEYWLKVKEAERLLSVGDELKAKDQAALLSSLLVELQKQLVARSKK